MKNYVLEIQGKEYTAELNRITSENAEITINGLSYNVKLKAIGRRMPVISEVRPKAPAAAAGTSPAASSTATPPPPSAVPKPVPGDNAGAVKSPLPGLILNIFVREGDSVKSGQNLMTMEAMKMENHVQAPYDGTVKRILVKKGDSVIEGDSLAEIDRPFMTTL